MLIPIVAPWVRRAGTERLDNLAPWVITPHRAAQRNALLRRRAGDAHLARTRRAATAIKPAVRAESQAVGESVVHVRRTSQAVKDNFGRAVRHVVTVAIGEEKQSGRTHHPDAAVPDLDAGQ